MKIIPQNTKTLITRDNDRSSDAVSPNFIYGCLGGCMNSYCYVGRYNHDKVYLNQNLNDILKSLTDWVNKQPWPKQPNQIHDKYYMIDIGCSTDVSLMQKHYDWQKVFDFFNKHEKLKFTFATKYPTMFNPERYSIHEDNRIRVSIMPQKYSSILEPNTDFIYNRIQSISNLQNYMEVHINFSPIIYTDGWLDQYNDLFSQIKENGINTKSECIFLTHNENQNKRNSDEVKNLIWKPEIQEGKDSQYAKGNIRYKSKLKTQMISQFIDVYTRYFPKTSIRYIF